VNNLNIPILPISYLPPISYFVLLYKAEQVQIERHESYPKQTYRNRCEIYTEKGKTSLSIPVSKPNGNNTITSEVRMFNEDKWFVRHWRAIDIAYSTSPYFLYYRDDIKPFFDGSYDSLLQFDLALIKHFCEILEIKTPVILTDTYIRKPSENPDFRDILTPKKPPFIDEFSKYTQVFDIKHGFIPNLSIIDLLFNLGPESADYISRISSTINTQG
jgi:hypothetical protein